VDSARIASTNKTTKCYKRTQAGAFVPASAAPWAEDIGDTPLRLRAMEAVGAGWLANDAPTARAWITKASLPHPAKARLLAHAPPQTS